MIATVVNCPLVVKIYSETVTKAMTLEVTVRVSLLVSARVWPRAARAIIHEVSFVISCVRLGLKEGVN